MHILQRRMPPRLLYLSRLVPFRSERSILYGCIFLCISERSQPDHIGPRINSPRELWVCVRHTGNLLLYSQKITSLEVPAQVPALASPASRFRSRWQRILQDQDAYQLRSITSSDLNRLEEQYVVEPG